jgi:hypothetical protein
MDQEIVKQILDELFSSFEDSETQSAALLLFLKNQGIATEEKLAPYFEQAANTSEVRWRAARVRMGALLASALKTPERAAEKKITAAQRRAGNQPQTLTARNGRGQLQNPNLRVPKTRQEVPLPRKMRLKTLRRHSEEQIRRDYGSALIRVALSGELALVRVISMEAAKFPEFGERFYKL